MVSRFVFSTRFFKEAPMKLIDILALGTIVFFFLSSACSGAQGAAGASSMERISTQRSALAAISSQEDYAKRAQTEISEIDTILRRVEQRSGSKDSNVEELTLMLDATQAQLAHLQTLYARWDEEARLENLRLRYERRMERIESLREANDSMFNEKDNS